MSNRFVDMVEQSSKAAEALVPEASVMAYVDPVGVSGLLGRAAFAVLKNPRPALKAGSKFAGRLAQAASASVSIALGVDTDLQVEPHPKDKRYTDPAWRENPFFAWHLQRHLLFSEFVDELLEASDLEGTDAQKLELVANLAVNAVQPTNFLWRNPTALKRAFETSGRSLIKGATNFVDDFVHNSALPRQVDTKPFKVGENLAATPGKVVYRNDLIELIQYAPQTGQVHSTPLLFSPPWINKYYVMDLAPDRSLVEWGVKHGHTVFAISYRNPDPSMATFCLEDYLINGPRAALEVVKEITGSNKVDLMAVCLGGSLAMMLASYLEAIEDESLSSITLLNTLLDYSEPGLLGAFTDRTAIERIEARLDNEGMLPASHMRRTFDLLRPNELVFSYVASNWLMGESPPAFDLLAWNEDSTNMPAAMHSFYMRNCYLENRLMKGDLKLSGRRLDLAKIQSDMFIVGAINDHIVPWTSSYASTQLLPKSDMTYVLSSSGHIAGIINPPGPKTKSWVNAATPKDPQTWFDTSDAKDCSWWELWADWAKQRSGDMVDPPRMGSDRFPVVDDAPGLYVHG